MFRIRYPRSAPGRTYKLRSHVSAGFAVIVLTLAEFVLQELGRDLDFPRGDAFLEFQLISKGKVQSKQVFDMVGDGMIAVADDAADISPDL